MTTDDLLEVLGVPDEPALEERKKHGLEQRKRFVVHYEAHTWKSQGTVYEGQIVDKPGPKVIEGEFYDNEGPTIQIGTGDPRYRSRRHDRPGVLESGSADDGGAAGEGSP